MTIFHVERDPAYNATLALLQSLAAALGAELFVTLKEKPMDQTTTQIGNDEAILHVRKMNPTCTLTNEILGKRTWTFIRDELGGEKIEDDQPALWSDPQAALGAHLPKSAAQFRVRFEVLPKLYQFLDSLASQ
jgi:hypothetical protein